MLSLTPLTAHYKTLTYMTIVGVFLAGLTGCGGGGSADPATPLASPQIVNTPAGATSTTPLGSTPSSNTSSVGPAPTPSSTAVPSATLTVTPTTMPASTPTATVTLTSGTTTTATVTNAPVTTCSDPQASLPSRGTATQELVYEADGRDGNTLVTIQEFSQDLVNPNDASFGGGPYYGLLTVTDKTAVTDGLGISPLTGALPTVGYYQFVDNKQGLIGTVTLNTQRSRTLTTALYTPVFYNPMFSLAAGQSVTHTVTSLVTSIGNVTSSVSTTQRIEFVGIETYAAGTTSYTACKYVTTDLPAGKTTTAWYWLGRDVLLQSVVQENDSLGSKVLVERRILKRAALNSVLYFTRT